MGGRIDDIAVSRERSEHHLHRLRGRRRVQVGEQRHDVRAGVRDVRHARRSATSPSIRRIPTSSTSAPASRTTGRRRRSATASTRRPTAERRSRTSASRKRRRSRASSSIRRTPRPCTSRRRATCSAPTPSAASTRRPTAARPGTRSSSSTTNTGFTDIAIDPSNSNMLYAASYQRRRSGCCFNGGGPGSAMWKSDRRGQDVDEADGHGLPPGTYGRIALDVVALESERRLRADRSGRDRHAGATPAVEADAATEATPAGAAAVTPPGGRSRPAAAGRAGGRGAAAGGGAAPAERGGRGGRRSTGATTAVRPRATLAGRGGGGGGTRRAAAAAPAGRLRRSIRSRAACSARTTRAQSWTLVSNCNARPMYFSQLRVDPTNDKTIYVAGLPVAKSLDGGKTFATLDDGRRQRVSRGTSTSTRSGSIRRTRSTS